MALYERAFVVENAAQIHKLFQTTILEAEAVERLQRRRGLSVAGATRRNLLRAYGTWQREMDDLSRATAAEATKAIKEKLKTTAKRPDTGVGPHLRDLIRCRPLSVGGFTTGSVGIADIGELNKAVNPLGPQYGPYWFAQEEGSTRNVGREITGFFFGTGYAGPPSPPDPAQSRQHPIFVTGAQGAAAFGGAGFDGGAGVAGGRGRRMLIQRPIQARHFIRDGANQARGAWFAGLRRIEDEALARLVA